jgi:hypothetical protein
MANGDTNGTAEADANDLIEDMERTRDKVTCEGYPVMERAVRFTTRHCMAMQADVRMTKKAVDQLGTDVRLLPSTLAATLGKNGNGKKEKAVAVITLPTGVKFEFVGREVVRDLMRLVWTVAVIYLIAKQHGWLP